MTLQFITYFKRAGLLVSTLCMLSQIGTAGAAPTTEANYPAAIMRLAGSPFFSTYAFIAEKQSRTLSVWSEKDGKPQLIEKFPIDFGRGGGNKLHAGDKNTPEGIYFLLEKLQNQKLSFDDYGVHAVPAFTTNYPNLFDRREGKTGNGIWLHTVPDSIPLTRGSKGCVIVRNDVIEKLAKYVVLERTPLLIFDQVPLLKDVEWTAQQQQFANRLQDWRKAWEGKKLEQYMSYYSDNFRGNHMDKQGWKRFKKGLNANYTEIHVQFSEPSIYIHKDQAVARFLQAYQSDKKADYGEKTVYWRLENGVWQIVGETWDEVTTPAAYAVLKPLGELRAPSTTATTAGDQGDSASAMNRDLPKPESLVK